MGSLSLAAVPPELARPLRLPGLGKGGERAVTIIRILATCSLSAAVLGGAASHAGAQSRVGADSSSRIARPGHDLAYGTAEGLAWAAVDQQSNSPPEWGHGWRGYG